jgi:hypothetical protein
VTLLDGVPKVKMVTWPTPNGGRAAGELYFSKIGTPYLKDLLQNFEKESLVVSNDVGGYYIHFL